MLKLDKQIKSQFIDEQKMLLECK